MTYLPTINQWFLIHYQNYEFILLKQLYDQMNYILRLILILEKTDLNSNVYHSKLNLNNRGKTLGFLNLATYFQYDIMNLNVLTAISPVDGRYRRAGKKLAAYFSEYAHQYRKSRNRIFYRLCEIPLPQLASINKSTYSSLRDLPKL